MILSSADILRILGGSEIIRLSAKLKIVDGKPALSGAEGLFIYIDRFPRVDEFQATWFIYIESDGSEPDDLVLAEIQKLLPSAKVQAGLLTTVTTTDFLSANTQRAPEAPKQVQTQVDLTQYEERFQALVEDVQDQMLLVTSGRPGRDGRDGVNGRDGRNGRDIVATETDLEDLANVEQGIAKENGQVLTWKDGKWQNLFVPQIVSSISGGGGGGGGASALNDLTDVDTETTPPEAGQGLVWDPDLQLWVPGNVSSGGPISGSIWKYRNNQQVPPPDKKLTFNNADYSLVTEIYIDKDNQDGEAVGNYLLALILAGTKLYIQRRNDDSQAVLFDVTTDAIDGGSFVTVPVVFNTSTGNLLDNDKEVALTILGGGGAPGGVTSIDDLTDVDTSTTAPLVGDILEWNGSQWVPVANSGGTGIGEAPQDGKYYVRQNGAWVDLQIALGQLTTPDTNVDGADFTQGVTTAQNSNIYDGGNFTTGSSAATDTTFLDGEVFTGALDDTVIDGGTAST